MKNKKMWIFIGIIILILICNHIFGWSSYLGNTKNLKFLEQMVKDNLILAILIYTVLTIISCVVLALPGVTFAIIAGLVLGRCLEQSAVLLLPHLERWWHLLWEDFFYRTVSDRWQ